MKLNSLLVSLLMLLFVSMNVKEVRAQTTQTLQWDYTRTLAEVGTYTQTVNIDNIPVTTALNCIVKPTNALETICSMVIPALTPGAHKINIRAERSGMSAEVIVNGINTNNGPGSATGIRVNITVIVNIP